MLRSSLATAPAAALLVAPILGAPPQEAIQWTPDPWAGHWRGELLYDSDDRLTGSLPFNVERNTDTVWIINGEERIEVPDAVWTDDRVELSFPHFDSVLEANRVEDATLTTYVGTWRKQRRGDDVAEMPFRLTERPSRFPSLTDLPPESAALVGRWKVDFESAETPAVGIFDLLDDELDQLHGVHGHGDGVVGTFLTSTGDYRFLEGRLFYARDKHDERTGRLVLSCFDGAHAFLFDATLFGDDRLEGTFRSGDWWEESWIAVRDEEIALPDPYSELELHQTTRVSETLALRPDGSELSLAELWASRPEPPRAMLVQVLGTWCPNCYDETNLLKELQARYADAGLSIVGLCFELTGDIERDLAQIARYQTTREVPYPLLWAGEASKRDTAEALGLTDRILSYPTTLFIDALGNIDAVHSGFVGPAAAGEHAELRADFEQRIEGLLQRYSPSRYEAPLTSEVWTSPETWPSGEAWLTLGSNATEPFVLVDATVRSEARTLEATVRGELVTGAFKPFIYHPDGYLQSIDGTRRLRPKRRTDRNLLIAERLELQAAFGAATDAPERLALFRSLVDHAAQLSTPLDGELVAAQLVDPDPALRREALQTLAPSQLPQVTEAVARALESADPRTRRAAARLVRRAWDEAGDPLRRRLEELATSDPFPSVVRAAH